MGKIIWFSNVEIGMENKIIISTFNGNIEMEYDNISEEEYYRLCAEAVQCGKPKPVQYLIAITICILVWSCFVGIWVLVL